MKSKIILAAVLVAGLFSYTTIQAQSDSTAGTPTAPGTTPSRDSSVQSTYPGVQGTPSRPSDELGNTPNQTNPATVTPPASLSNEQARQDSLAKRYGNQQGSVSNQPNTPGVTVSTSKSAAVATANISSWPQASQTAANEMISKYGQPDASTPDMMIWKDKGDWKKIVVSKHETKHKFPMDHTDMLEQVISHKVPVDKIDDLAKFDGSISVDRTRGLLSARCDKEENNILALNVAHDIIIGKRTAEAARTYFTRNVKLKQDGGNPAYMNKLQFTPDADAAFEDVNVNVSSSGSSSGKQ